MKDPKRVPVNDLDYEDCYAEALTILREKYDSVSVSYRNEDGERVCDVETLHADDMTVFMLAEVAHKIQGCEPVGREEKHPHRRHTTKARAAASRL